VARELGGHGEADRTGTDDKDVGHDFPHFSKSRPVIFPNRHPRESGDPGRAAESAVLDSRFRGNDGFMEG
jgi:hypothetical protein